MSIVKNIKNPLRSQYTLYRSMKLLLRRKVMLSRLFQTVWITESLCKSGMYLHAFLRKYFCRKSYPVRNIRFILNRFFYNARKLFRVHSRFVF
jgi:hypothetical protein